MERGLRVGYELAPVGLHQLRLLTSGRWSRLSMVCGGGFAWGISKVFLQVEHAGCLPSQFED